MEHGATSLLTDIGVSIVFATVTAHAARALRQPLILGYVLGGVALGTQLGFGLVTDPASIELISEIGLLLLLFIIGLEINVRELAAMGSAVFALGVTQFTGCVVLGLVFFGGPGGGTGGGRFDGLYLAVALSLSSTLIVVKLLQDKFEIRTAAGRLTLGVLMLQDLWAILFMAIQPNLLKPEVLTVFQSLAQGLVLVCAAFLVSRHVLSQLLLLAAKTPELVVLTATAWCFSLCGLAEGAGLSKEMGALAAGLSIAAFPYGTDVIAKLTGVRDFFVTLFFVALGLKVARPSGETFTTAALVVLFVLASRLLTVAPAAAVLRQGLRNGLVTGLNLAQVSEFSLVIVALGASHGHVSSQIQSLVLTAMLLASVVSTYVIQFNSALAGALMRLALGLGYREPVPQVAGEPESEPVRDVVLLGCFRGGRVFLDRVAETAPELKGRICVVDFNPALQQELEPRGFRWAYGDLAHPDTLAHSILEHASVVVCSVSDTFLKGTTNRELLSRLQKLAPEACFVMSADDVREAERLRQTGARDVIVSADLAGRRILAAVEEVLRGQA